MQILNPTLGNDREELQKYGTSLDEKTNGEWVSKALGKIYSEHPEDDIIVDSIRIRAQIQGLYAAYPRKVIHIYIDASPTELARRYESRKSHHEVREATQYQIAADDPTEKQVPSLKENADILVSSERCTAADITAIVASQLQLYERSYEKSIDVLIGGQYGSEGKGNIAAYIAPEYEYLLRVGGPNAGHKVYNAPMTFRHLPSGTETNVTAKLILGPGAVLNVDVLLREIATYKIGSDRLFIDPNAFIITKKDIDNEERLQKSIGSTKQGVGAATVRRIWRDADKATLAKDTKNLKPFLKPTLDVLDEAFRKGAKILLEGTQGTGLSLYHGSYPHVTSRDTTVGGCISEAGIAPSRIRRIVMVCRTYPIRVQSPEGATSGDMSQEITLQAIHERSDISLEELEKTETTSTTKRRRRIAEFDWQLLKTASQLNGPTDIALSFVDYLSIKNREARRFEQLTSDTINFIERVESVAKAPVSLISTRFDYRNIIDRRNW